MLNHMNNPDSQRRNATSAPSRTLGWLGTRNERDAFEALDGPLPVHRLLHALQPAYVLSRLARLLPKQFLPYQIYLDSLGKPAYAYGVYVAALQARFLGYDRISVIEFGVARGHGLLALEAAAKRIGDYFGIDIQAHGFDTGKGLPKPEGIRDHPYLWSQGYYDMDEAELRSRLTSAELWLGPVAETLPKFSAGQFAPVGFISFDLDYYSSTIDALRIFDLLSESRLPRVICYFDDVLIPDYSFYTDAAGELLAIHEFNQSHPEMEISRLRSLPHVKPLPAPWHAQMYTLHDFQHPRYADDFQPTFTRQFDALPA